MTVRSPDSEAKRPWVSTLSLSLRCVTCVNSQSFCFHYGELGETIHLFIHSCAKNIAISIKVLMCTNPLARTICLTYSGYYCCCVVAVLRDSEKEEKGDDEEALHLK